MRVAIYHPWIYLKSGLERTLLEIHRRSRHEVTLHTGHYDREGTYPELAACRIVTHGRISVRRAYLPVIGAAARIAMTRIDPSTYDALVVSCDGLGDLLTLRNRAKPVVALCFTPLRAAYDEAYRARLLDRAGALRPLALVAEAGWRAIDRACWRNYAEVVAISGTVRDRIEAGGLWPPGRARILYPGIDAARIGPGRPAEPYFLVAGRIMWTKNLRLALEAFARAKPSLPGWRLVLAGMVDEKSRAHAEALMERGREIGDVEFRIGATDAEMRDLYEGCAALLFTAFNEDWGLTPIEAMAAGRPVVAVDRGGPRESVLHGTTGFLEPDDPDAFAARMVELARDPALCERLGAAGLDRARGFTWDAFVAGLDAAVEDMVGRDREGRSA